jgi:hypothetical protein
MENVHQIARQLVSEGHEWDGIREKLQQTGLSEEKASEIVNLLKSEKITRNRNRGLTLLMIGAAICLFSMIYTFAFGHSYTMLYGLTMVGVSLCFAGLVCIMG